MTSAFLKHNDKEVYRLLDELSQRGKDLKPITSGASLIMHKDIIERFKEEEDHEGKPWAALSPITIARRKNKDKGKIKKLRDTGRLVNSIKPKHGKKWAAVIAGGSNVEYAATHNYGDSSRNIKARSYTEGLSESAHKKIFTLTTRHFFVN